MTKTQLNKKTVTQLRALCGQRGLPKYQSRGRRLRKADLVKQLLAPSAVLQPTEEVYGVESTTTHYVKLGPKGVRKYRQTSTGVVVKSPAWRLFEVMVIVDHETGAKRYADPVDPDTTWSRPYPARDAVARRILAAELAKPKKPAKKQPKLKRRVLSQRELDSMWRDQQCHTQQV